MTLSAGLSQGSNAGKGGGSQGDVCEISSDGTSDGSDGDDDDSSGGNEDDEDIDSVSPVKKAVHADRVRRRDNAVHATLGSTAMKPCLSGLDGDDDCKIVFTRVCRPSSSSTSARSRKKSRVENGTLSRREVGRGSSCSAGSLSESRGDSCDASDEND